MTTRAFHLLMVLAAVMLATGASAAQSENHELHAVPPPGAVAIDGKLDDWDFSGQIWCFSDYRTREIYSAKVAAMYDKDFLYLSVVWKDPTPMQNMVDPDTDGNGWKSDCLQLRMITDLPVHVDCWYSTAAKRPVIKLSHGSVNKGPSGAENFGPAPDAIQAGAKEAFAPGTNGKSYTQEIALPWKLITGQSATLKETGKPFAEPKSYLAGDTFTMGLDFRWGGADGRTNPLQAYSDLVKVGGTRTWFHAADTSWGTVKLEPAGGLKLPAPDYAAAEDAARQKTSGSVALSYSMPFDGYATLVIEDEQGLRVKNLIGMAPRGKGKQTDYWDGTGEDGKPAPPGKYRWRGLVHKGIEPEYAASYGCPAATPWETADGTGGWLSDTNPPCAVAAGKDVMVIAAESAKAGWSIICVDLDGRKKWGDRSLAGIKYIAVGGGQVYALLAPKEAPPALARLDLKTGRPVPFATKEGPKPTVPVFAEKQEVLTITGIAVIGERVGVSLRDVSRVRLFDRETGAFINDAGGATYSTAMCGTESGATYIWSKRPPLQGIVKIEGDSFKPIAITRMNQPPAIAADETRGLFFEVDPVAKQVRVYDKTGAFARAIGRLGGREAGGREAGTSWQGEGMRDPSSVAVDSQGRVWVAEKSVNPGRVSVWDADGSLVRDFIVALGGAEKASADPDDRTRVFAGGCEFKLDYKTGRAALVSEGLGDVSGQVMKFKGREYFMNKKGMLYLRTGGTLKPVATIAGFIWAETWKYWDYPIQFTVETEANGDPSGHHWCYESHFLWMDLNDDGKPQDDETIAGGIVARSADWKFPFGLAGQCGCYWLDEDFNLYSSGREATFYGQAGFGPAVVKLPLKGWTPGGTPIWDFKNQRMLIGVIKSTYYDDWHAKPPTMRYTGSAKGYEVKVRNGQNLFSGDPCFYLPADGKAVVGPPITCVRDDGTILWTYRDEWPGLQMTYWDKTIPTVDRADYLIGTAGCLGRAKTKVGTVFAIHSSVGRMYLMTLDGLFVASVFEDNRLGRPWPSAAKPGMSLDGLTMGRDWLGHFYKAGSEYYVIAGTTACNVMKLNGFDSLKAIPGGELTVAGKESASTTAVKVAAPAITVKTGKALAFDLSKAVAKNATLASGADTHAPRIRINGKQQGPAGIEIPADKCDLSAYRFVVAEVRNAGARPVAVRLRIENANAASFVADGLDLDPRQGWTWAKVGIRRPGDAVKVKMFGMAEYPWGRPHEAVKTGADIDVNDRWLTNAFPWARAVGAADGPGIDPANVARISILVDSPAEDCTLDVRNVQAAGVAPSAELLADPNRFFPCIDEFGQYIHADWPGKVKDVADLKKQREAEAKDLAANPAPEEWNQYGGWKNGPSLTATGRFYVTKYEGKWWMVDPEGKLFFSTGITNLGIQARETVEWPRSTEADETPVQDREPWFRNMAKLHADFGECIVAGSTSMKSSGYYGHGPVKASFDFPQANNMRKYGITWAHDVSAIAHRRLRSWGMNTVGINTPDRMCYINKTPYILCFRARPPAQPANRPRLENGVFPDLFRDDCDGTHPQQGLGHVPFGGMWMGALFDVEGRGEIALDFGSDDVAYALAALRQQLDPAVPRCAKTVFIDDLKGKYGTIEKLNEAWGTGHASWDALQASTETPDVKKAHADLAAFHAKALDTYFSRPAWRMANRLYMGALFERAGAAAIAAAAKYCDVLCFRLNSISPANFRLPEGIDKPVLIAEFGFSALDRGMLAGNLPDQAARAAAYKQYMLEALRNPQIIGCHWSQYRDNPASGRVRDEANYNAGFVDIADTPYAEMVQAAREIGKTMYRTRLDAR